MKQYEADKKDYDRIIIFLFEKYHRHNDTRFYYKIISPTMIYYLLGVPILVIIYLFYEFIIKIYLASWKFKKMDPSLKTYIAPFFGMLGIQQ